MEQRIGRQTPTASVIEPYEKTDGEAAVALYDASGRTMFEWQQLVVYDMLARNNGGLWSHTRFGMAVPRRNGKNEVIIAREMYGLLNGEHILHTAHRATTSHSAWERLLDQLYAAKVEIPERATQRAMGNEHIYLPNGGRIVFRTRTRKGGIGEGYDTLVIDEAQEYDGDQASALKYVVSSSKNPQTIYIGTPPTPQSSGTVFRKYREDVLSGKLPEAAWEEWAVEEMTDPEDMDAWYETNPSLGMILTERSIRDEISGDIEDFNIQRLGLWTSHNLKSAISLVEWRRCQEEALPELVGPMFVGIKFSKDNTAAMCIGFKTAEGDTFLEAIDDRDARNGNDWIVGFLKAAKDNIGAVIVDGASGQGILAQDMKDADLKIKPVWPRVSEVVMMNAAFEQAVVAQTIRHMGQPSLADAVSNCEHRAIGSGFGFRSIKLGVDMALLDSAILAHYGVNNIRPKGSKKQSVGY